MQLNGLLYKNFRLNAQEYNTYCANTHVTSIDYVNSYIQRKRPFNLINKIPKNYIQKEIQSNSTVVQILPRCHFGSPKQQAIS